MNALNAKYQFTITNCGKTLELSQADDIRIYPTGRNKRFGEELTARQVDLIRIVTAVHVADAWICRKATFNGLRNPIVQIEVLDPTFWSNTETTNLLKACVDFVSGGDDWEFSFVGSQTVRHERCTGLFRQRDRDALVAPYSAGLDSATGLAVRAAAQADRMIVPVTVRHQMQKSQLLRRHYKLLMDAGIVKGATFHPFQAGAFIRNQRIKREYQEQFREITHRCRPLIFMAVAGLIADSLGAPEVEVFESGVGSVNLPLFGGPADFRTTRSTHPHFLQLLSSLISHVNGAAVKFVLPFANATKGEMVGMLKELGLEELARMSVSCILHPLKRRGWQQCGRCPACIFRRQAMHTAGIMEDEATYATNLFTQSTVTIAPKQMRWILAFHEQISNLHELDNGIVPSHFRRYLKATKAASNELQIAQHAEVYRRYRREWLSLIEDAHRHDFPWITSSKGQAEIEGAIA